MPIDRNKILWRIGVKMQDTANKGKSIGPPAAFDWGELIVALASFSDEMLETNRDKFSEFLQEGE